MFRLPEITIIRVNIKTIQRKVLVLRVIVYDLKLRSRQYCIVYIQRAKKDLQLKRNKTLVIL